MSSAILAAAKTRPKVKKKPGWREGYAARLQPEEANEFVFKPKPGQSFFQDTEYQTALLSLLCKDAEALRRVGHILRMEDFKPAVADPTSKLRWLISYHALDHFRRTGQPVGNMLSSRLKENASQSNMKPDEREALISYGKKLLAMNIVGAGDIIERAAEFKRQVIKAAALDELIELQAAGKLTDEEWSRINEKTIAAISEGSNSAPTSAAALLQQDFPEINYLLNPIMPRGLTLIAARPKAGKSWLALQLGIATATSSPFLGRKIKTPGPVLYAALEDGPRRIKERIGMLLGDAINDAALKEKMDRMEFLFELPPLQTGGLLLLERKLKEAQEKRVPFSLLVIDHFLAAAGEQKARDFVRAEYKEIASLRRLSEKYGLAIVLIHHLRKQPAADAGETVIGTTGITAAVDSLWLLTPGTDDKSKKLEIKGRDIKEKVLEVRLMFTSSKRGWQVVDEGSIVKAGPVGKQILKHLKAAGPQKPIQIAAALGMPSNSVYENLHRLHKRELVLKEGNRYAYPR